MVQALTTVELFAGIGGFRIAADSVGLKTIWANDLKPLSCSVYRQRFGDGTLIEGDIHTLIDSIPKHDVLTAGFPCQPFSSAGKKEGIRDPRGTLFESIVEVLATKQPGFFVLENVKRLLSMEHGAHFATVLSALSALDYFIEWRVLNAKHFGLAQNRERIVIVGTRYPNPIEHKDNVSSLLRLATPVEIWASSKQTAKRLMNIDSWQALDKHSAKFPNWGLAYKGTFTAHDVDVFADAQSAVLLHEILEPSPPDEYDLTEATIHRLDRNESVDKFVNGVEIISNQSGGARMGYTIFGINGLAPTLTASTSRHYERYFVNGRYRRLTPTEYARLQGFTDDHCNLVKPYDRYNLLGNAVPPALIAWVLNKLLLPPTMIELPEDNQMELFYA